MTKKFIAGGCSFTFGNELSDDDGKTPSKFTWAHKLYKHTDFEGDYICTAKGGYGNQAIARRVFQAIDDTTEKVVVMWTFLSRYDWAMPRHKLLEDTRWTSISPWDTKHGQTDAIRSLAGSEAAQDLWKERQLGNEETHVRPFANALYQYAANEYHETYLSWKSIIWLQNLLEKKNIKYFFTLADNSLFYRDLDHHKDQDALLSKLHNEIDFSNWFFFGERCMGFNQWARLNEYAYATTHPLDEAHEDAVKLMLPAFEK